MIDLLRQMAIFAKTIDHGSFRGAARDLKLSPSVVSHHISQLEEHLGVALIYRSTRKLTLTREGERLLVAARNMLEAVESELLELSLSGKEPSGELRITLGSILSQSQLTDIIADFSMAYPRIKISLGYSDLRKDLIEGGFDNAIRMGAYERTSASSRRLFKFKRRIVASKSYLSQHATIDDPKQLSDYDWMSLPQAPTSSFLLHKPGSEDVSIKTTPHMLANDASALYRLARAGAGLAVVPEFLALDDEAADVVEFVLPDWALDPIDVFAVWPSNAPKTGLINLLMTELSKVSDRLN